jgi:hypothetical protein
LPAGKREKLKDMWRRLLIDYLLCELAFGPTSIMRSARSNDSSNKYHCHYTRGDMAMAKSHCKAFMT